MIKTPLVFIDDILQSIRIIRDYAKELSEDDFYRSSKDQDAIIRRLLIIGEAAFRLPEGFRDKYPHVPWRKMASMRHRLVHAYDDIRLDLVWETIQKDLLPLKAQLEEILESEQGIGR